MATKSKAQTELDALRASIPEVLQEMLEKYGLVGELCSEGLQDFCERLGTKWSSTEDYEVRINIEGVKLPGTHGRYGHDIDNDLWNTLQNAIETAISEVFVSEAIEYDYINVDL